MPSESSQLLGRLEGDLKHYVKLGLLGEDKVERMLKQGASTLDERVTIFKAVLSAFITLVATFLMSLSFIFLVALIFRVDSARVYFFICLLSYLPLAALLARGKLYVPATTLGLVGIVSSAGCLFASKIYLILAVIWFGVVIAAFWYRDSLLHRCLLMLCGAGVFWGCTLRLLEVARSSLFALRGASGALAAVCFIIFILAWLRRGSVLYEYRMRPVLIYQSALLFLLSFFSLTFVDGHYQVIDVALNLSFFVLVTGLMIFARRQEDSILFSSALSFWILFVFVKYFDLFYELLNGSLVSFALGLILLVLARGLHKRAESAGLETSSGAKAEPAKAEGESL